MRSGSATMMGSTRVWIVHNGWALGPGFDPEVTERPSLRLVGTTHPLAPVMLNTKR